MPLPAALTGETTTVYVAKDAGSGKGALVVTEQQYEALTILGLLQRLNGQVFEIGNGLKTISIPADQIDFQIQPIAECPLYKVVTNETLSASLQQARKTDPALEPAR